MIRQYARVAGAQPHFRRKALMTLKRSFTSRSPEPYARLTSSD